MRLLIFLCLGVLLASAAEDVDVVLNYDFEPVLKSEAKWKEIYNCYMDRAPCGEYQAVKDASIRLYKNQCDKCNSAQTAKFGDLLQRTIEKYPMDVTEIINKVTSA